MLYSIPFGFVDGLVDGLEGLAGWLEVEATATVVGFMVNFCDENLVVGNSRVLLGNVKLVKNDADSIGVTWLCKGLGDTFLVNVGLMTTVECLVEIVEVDITPVST